MSYRASAALQSAVYACLSGDETITAPVFDAAPSGTLPETYVILGAEEVKDRSDAEDWGALHWFDVSVVSTVAGFLEAKQVAAAIAAALEDSDLPLSSGRLVWLKFLKGKARRTADGRQIDLRFRAQIAAQ